MLAHRPWWEQIPEFLTENVEPSIHDFRLTRETVAPADPDEFLSDNECLEPGAALAVVSRYHLTSIIPVSPGMWVVGAASVELGLGLALVVGLFTRGVAAVAFGTFTLTLFALPDDPILAHISLFGLTSALLITGSGRLGLDNL